MGKRVWNPEVGEQAMAYYDGKWSRGVPCEILEVDDVHRIKVRHEQWAANEGDGPVEYWAQREKDYQFGGYTEDKTALMAVLFGFPGDWYAIRRKEEENGQG